MDELQFYERTQGQEEIQSDINIINVENLFWENKEDIKLTYSDYCYIANDFYTQHIGIYIINIKIDEEALKVLQQFGYPRSFVIDSLQKGELNHAVASYNLLVIP